MQSSVYLHDRAFVLGSTKGKWKGNQADQDSFSDALLRLLGFSRQGSLDVSTFMIFKFLFWKLGSQTSLLLYKVCQAKQCDLRKCILLSHLRNISWELYDPIIIINGTRDRQNPNGPTYFSFSFQHSVVGTLNFRITYAIGYQSLVCTKTPWGIILKFT